MAPSRIPTIGFRDIAYRYSNYDTPFWARANTRPGRWHVPGDGPTQYLSLSTDAAWAELIRAEDLRDEREVALVSMPIWQARIDQAAVVDYSDFGTAEAAGFAPDALVDDDHARCQREGRRLRGIGYTGVLAPSAALAGESSLTLFGARLAIAWSSTPHLVSTIPSAVLTRGAPPAGMIARARLYGQPHAGLADYQRRSRVRRRPA